MRTVPPHLASGLAANGRAPPVLVARPARASLAHAAAYTDPGRTGKQVGGWRPPPASRALHSARCHPPHVLIVLPCRWAHVWLSRRSLPVQATRNGVVKAAVPALRGTVNSSQ
jgi:hypothetical protein